MASGPDTSDPKLSNLSGQLRGTDDVPANIDSAGMLRLDNSLVDVLHSACTAPDPTALGVALKRFEQEQIPNDVTIDAYIPEVSRRLGERWCEDRAGFSEVTIGVARLQRLVRELTLARKPEPFNPNSPGVAIVTVEEEYHTLGALILSDQLQRHGISARLIVAAHAGSIDQGGFDAIFISMSHVETLENVRQFVNDLRKKKGWQAPIVVGGPILEVDDNAGKTTGADFATSDLFEALKLCRLKTSPTAQILRIGN